MSQKRTEFGVGCRITFIARIGCPRSARMKSRHIVTAPIARNSPRIVILPKAL